METGRVHYCNECGEPLDTDGCRYCDPDHLAFVAPDVDPFEFDDPDYSEQENRDARNAWRNRWE